MSSGTFGRGIAWAGLALCGVLAQADGIWAHELTIEAITSTPSLIGTEPRSPVWSPESSRLAFLWNRGGTPFRDVWIVAASGGKPTRLTDMARDFPAPEAPVFDPNVRLSERAAARRRPGVSELAWSPDGERLVFAYERELFQVDVDRANVERLTHAGDAKAELRFSPDAKYLSFIEGGDLWLRNEETEYLARATRVGASPVGYVPGGRYFRPDVELSRHAWSPDGRFIALHYDDRRAVRKVPFPDYLGEETHVNFLRRDYPGDNDHVRAVGIYSVEDGRLRLIELPDETDRRISNFAWSPKGDRLLVDQNSENAVHRWIYVVRTETLSARQVWHDRHDARVRQYYSSGWTSDGKRIVFVGDLDDRYRLYSIEPGSPTPERLTDGEWDVVSDQGTTRLEFSPETKEVFFQASEKSPYERHVYRMPEGGGELSRVTSLAGVHTPFVSPDGMKLAVLHSNDVTPTELYISDSRKQGSGMRITHSPLEAFYDHPWIPARYVTFQSRIDDYTLHGRILEPPQMDPSKRYPVVLGPVYSNTVRNQWRGVDSTFQQYLALVGGYIVMQVDVRGSTGYGRRFREEFLGDWGGGDIEDLHSAVEFLHGLPYVDPGRIGIWGNSYGGTLTVFSLFKKPGVYRAGVAGAPAVSVAHFTTGDIRISRRPETHPEVFFEASALNYGENLRDPLLIVHGMQDDVVPFKTTIDLVEKLMLLGKDFDVAIAPRATHVWSDTDYYGTFLFRKVSQFFDRHLTSR